MQPPFEAHRPVLCDEVVKLLRDAPGEAMLDATLGDGGHAKAILEDKQNIVLFGIDRDPSAIAFARERLAIFGERVKLFVANFGNLTELASNERFPPFGAALLDLGLSSRQLDSPERGFSFSADGPLDMRMGEGCAVSAFEVLNSMGEGELAKIIIMFGEQRGAWRIAREIIKMRREKPIETTRELVAIVKKALPGADNSDLARVFQALRIFVNDELAQLEGILPALLEMMLPSGILITICYHSLEDRIVKRFIRREEKGCICPPELPVCRCGRRPRLERITKKAIIPSAEEIESNPRARSAKLRASRVIG